MDSVYVYRKWIGSNLFIRADEATSDAGSGISARIPTCSEVILAGVNDNGPAVNLKSENITSLVK